MHSDHYQSLSDFFAIDAKLQTRKTKKYVKFLDCMQIFYISKVVVVVVL